MRWEEVVGELRARGLVAVEGRRWLGLAWHFGSGVQRQRVELASPSGRDPRLVVSSEVLPLVHLSLLALLRHNARTVAGALAVEGPLCVLRSIVPLAELEAGVLVQGLVVAAHEASRLRRQRLAAAGPTPHVVE
jgi:hypothetical protein